MDVRSRIPRIPFVMSLLGGLGALAMVTAYGARVRSAIEQPLDRHKVPYVGSKACRRCHEDHYASWHRTFHRTMTQEAGEDSVLAPFDGRRLRYFGWTARFLRDGDAYRLAIRGPDGPFEYPVDRVVGSRRYQQFLSRQGDTFLRLPVAWDIEESRFFHLNGAFLSADPASHPASRSDFERHQTRWNDNCVFCHNVAPRPGLRAGPGGPTFATEVAELGIACEACHGPGAEHEAKNRDPIRRYLLHAGAASADPTIVNPGALSPQRAADVCGRCHGQRLTDDIDRVLREGDPFQPGEDLARYSEPLWRDTPLRGREGVFAARFWEDGTPRLTAYEYQGWLQTRCGRGTLTCTTCHGMHEGDPAGQLRPTHRGDDTCTGCHTSLNSSRSHNVHRVPSSAPLASCVSCHMPRIVYGLTRAHRSHRIEIPDPARDAHHHRPDACTLCHVNQSRAWAIAASMDPATSVSPISLSEVTRAALGGDPLERALAVDALGRSSFGRPEARLGVLLEVMGEDPYPGVRRGAWRAARRIVDVDAGAFDPDAEPATQRDALRRLGARYEHLRVDSLTAARLRREAASLAIEIGE